MKGRMKREGRKYGRRMKREGRKYRRKNEEGGKEVWKEE